MVPKGEGAAGLSDRIRAEQIRMLFGRGRSALWAPRLAAFFWPGRCRRSAARHCWERNYGSDVSFSSSRAISVFAFDFGARRRLTRRGGHGPGGLSRSASPRARYGASLRWRWPRLGALITSCSSSSSPRSWRRVRSRRSAITFHLLRAAVSRRPPLRRRQPRRPGPVRPRLRNFDPNLCRCLRRIGAKDQRECPRNTTLALREPGFGQGTAHSERDGRTGQRGEITLPRRREPRFAPAGPRPWAPGRRPARARNE